MQPQDDVCLLRITDEFWGKRILVWRVFSVFAALALFGFTYMQLDDPDGWLWSSYYCACALCVLAVGFESRVTRFGTIAGSVLLVVTVAWAMGLVPSLVRFYMSAQDTGLLSNHGAENLIAERAIEALGLLITGVLLGMVLMVRRRKSRTVAS